MVSSESCAWLKLRRELLLAHLGLLLRPPNSSLGSSQRWYPHISAPPEVENMTWETSASLHGSKMALVCASLFPPHASPLQSFFLSDFYKHKMWCQGSQSKSQRYLDKFDVWFICSHEGLSTSGRHISEEKEERTGSRERVRGVKGIWGTIVKLDSHLGDGTTFSAHVLHESYGSSICPFLTLKPPQPQAMPSTCTLFHPKLPARTQQVINNDKIKNI